MEVEISDKEGQVVFETTEGAKFPNGGCDGRRYAQLSKTPWILPTAGSDAAKLPVTVWAGLIMF